MKGPPREAELTNVLRDFEVRGPPDLGVLQEEAADAALVEGEVLVFPVPRGRDLELRFANPFEPYLTLDGERVTRVREPDHARLLTWLGRRLPALDRALDLGHGMRAVLTETEVVAVDLVDLTDQSRLDHAQTLRRLDDCAIGHPAYAVLGPISGTGELKTRLRALYASGTLVEVRREEGGRVLGRRQLRAGR